jgi:beta-lactamase superfamily II metal-dependent hydrolase
MAPVEQETRMTKFIAIPVGQGDAFYLDKGRWSVLVDGGSGRKNFAKKFSLSTGVTAVDVAVCTHNDADHANGIIGFLQSSLVCNEI